MPGVTCEKCGTTLAPPGVGKWTCPKCGHVFEITTEPAIQVQERLANPPPVLTPPSHWSTKIRHGLGTGCFPRVVAGLAMAGGMIGIVGSALAFVAPMAGGRDPEPGSGYSLLLFGVIFLMGVLIESVWCVVDELQNR